MHLDIYDIIYYSNLLISALVGCVLFRKIEIQYKWLTVLIVLTLISEMTAKYVAYGLDKPNSIVYHFFTPLEYILLVIIFIYFINQKKWNRIITGSAAGLLVFEIVNTIYFQPLQETNTNTIIMESTLLVGLSLLLFLKIRETPSKQNILKKGVFWFNSAVLCYYSFNIIIWGFHSMKVYLLDNPPQIIYDFNMILSGILYLIYMLAIILNSKRVSETPE
jgi:hypothetical protein